MKHANLDRIELTEKDYYQLYKWKDNNKHSVRNFNPILNEGVIVIENNIKQYFKQDGIYVEYQLYLGEEFFFEFWCERLEGGKSRVLDIRWNELLLTKMSYTKTKAIEDALSLHASIMAYMEYFNEQKEYVVKKVLHKNTAKKKKNRKDKTRAKKIAIDKTVYTMYVRENTQPVTTKKPITRRAEMWTVEGHWRHYKSGKSVFIESYKKGQGRLTPKTYVMGS